MMTAETSVVRKDEIKLVVMAVDSEAPTPKMAPMIAPRTMPITPTTRPMMINRPRTRQKEPLDRFHERLSASTGPKPSRITASEMKADFTERKPTTQSKVMNMRKINRPIEPALAIAEP